jgi:E3 ubiquitin-protein ligase XIAP
MKNYNLNCELDRLRSFEDNNWEKLFIDIKTLSLQGFYYYKLPDRVKCVFCAVCLHEFEQTDDVLKDHLKYSPNCPLLRRRLTNNVPINSEQLDRFLPPASYDECGTGRRRNSRAEDMMAYPKYKLMSQRLSSFKTWPTAMKQKPQDLAHAGFFYSGHSDVTICFSCGLLVGTWEDDDNPWVEHKKLLETECNYLAHNQKTLNDNEKNYEEAQKRKLQ